MTRCITLPESLALKPAKTVGIAADHGGYNLKQYLVMMLREAGAEVIDFGDRRLVPDDDYPDFVVPLARAVAAGQVERGVAVCGSGVGACIVANKVVDVRACLIHDPFSAHQGVEDDDLNLICLGGLVVGHALAWELVRTFLIARFSGAERHRRRLGKVKALENLSSPKVIGSAVKTGEVSAQDLEPPIALWNSVAPESLAPAPDANDGKRSVLKQRAIDRWENEGGEIPNVPIPQPAAMSAAHSPGKKLFVFDLDGTLAESKAALDAEMAALLKTLLGQMKVAVISGGDWPQFESQLLANLSPDANLRNLSLLPTCGTKFYQFNSDWQQLYADDFTKAQKEKIIHSLEEAVAAEDFGIEETWGEQIEDRGSQITFSALGQRAPLQHKEKWDADFAKRKKIQALLKDLIPEFTVRLGGTTSIDVTKLGIDKAYGIKKLREIHGIELEEMLFVGDALFPGGNDYPVKEAGVVSIQVKNAEETKRVIETFLANSAGFDAPSVARKSRDEQL